MTANRQLSSVEFDCLPIWAALRSTKRRFADDLVRIDCGHRGHDVGRRVLGARSGDPRPGTLSKWKRGISSDVWVPTMPTTGDACAIVRSEYCSTMKFAVLSFVPHSGLANASTLPTGLVACRRRAAAGIVFWHHDCNAARNVYFKDQSSRPIANQIRAHSAASSNSTRSWWRWPSRSVRSFIR